jgi:hypothetical protein
MPIQQIKIRNFRSLREVSLEAKALTVFVGCNDEGKSNLLRALDLFFNGDRQGGYTQNWARDFSVFAKTPRNKAQQIEIVITFKLPDSFNVGQPVTWRKVWRQSGLLEDSIKLADGRALPPRSKADAYLKAMRYEYVPAIKGPDYFGRLLASMHDMLDATVRKDIRNAAASFTSEIRSHTERILTDIESQIGLKSDIELPTDLKQLFSELEFRSTIGAHKVALSQRGDGLKVRHIPVILRWLAQQANHLAAPGRPRVVTIWGYEEPENNLETRRCFELADFFIETSADVQTFLTTHSPVFYSVFNHAQSEVAVEEVKLNPDEGTRLVSRLTGQRSDIDALHSSVGFLDLLEPHVRDWRTKVEGLQRRIDEGLNTAHPTVFVEGPSDKQLLEAAFKRFYPDQGEVRVRCSAQSGGGHSWVKDSLIAWHHQRAQKRAVGLFDSDVASQQSIREFKELVEDRLNGRSRALKVMLKARGFAQEITKAKLALPIAIEELCPRPAWEKADSEGWLVRRQGLTVLYKFEETAISFDDWIAQRLPDDVLRLVATMRVADDHKERFSKLVAREMGREECSWDFGALRLLAGELLEKLELLADSP